MNPDLKASMDFLHLLWGEDLKELGLWANLWLLEGKKTKWARTAEECESFISKHPQNLYVGATFASARGKSTQRITAKTAAAIPGLWADIDVAGPAHTKPGLPPTIEDAMRLVEELPYQPTVLVHSGHGLQAWWLFDEPLVFETPEDREQATRLTYGWGRLIQNTAAKYGWVADSVHDLARVMRLPGTINAKKGQEQKLCRVLSKKIEKRWQPSTFEQFEAVPAVQRTRAPEIHVPDRAPIEKIQAMTVNDETFRLTYQRKRPDLADQSKSGYDLSLANQLVHAGWNDGEIVATIIHIYETLGDEIKPMSYYARTVNTARQHRIKDTAASNLAELAHVGTDGDTLNRDEALSNLSALFAITFHRIERIGGAGVEPTYTLTTAQGGIILGQIGAIMNQNTFRSRIAAATGIVPRRIGKKDKVSWDNVATIILAACEDVTSDEAADVHLSSILDKYLQKNAPTDDLDHAVPLEKPLTIDGQTHVFLNDLRKFMRFTVGDNISPKSLGMTLRSAGLERKRIRHKGRLPYVYVFPKKAEQSGNMEQTMEQKSADQKSEASNAS